MEHLPTTFYTALGAIFAALIAAVISLVSIFLSKDAKISELRQLWINDLRIELSSLISMINKLYCEYCLHEDLSPKGKQELKRKQIPDMQKIDELTHKLRMRLNPKEHEKLIKLILDLENVPLSNEMLNNDVKRNNLYDNYTKESQAVLKSEWQTVKDGESSFKYMKRITQATILICLATLLYHYVSIDFLTKLYVCA